MLPIIASILGPLVGKIIDTVGSKIGVDMSSDQIKGKKLDIELELQKLINEAASKQLDINEAEAANPNRRWITWREALGYVCVAAVAFNFLVYQVLFAICSMAGVELGIPPLDITGLMAILSGMLGIHFVDSRFNSQAGCPPVDLPSKGKQMVYNEKEGKMEWR